MLVRLARLTGVDMRWLLTGQFGPGDAVLDGGDLADAFAKLERFADPLPSDAASLKAMTAFVDLLEDHVDVLNRFANEHDAPDDADLVSRSLIPVVGRTAAGVPQFWASSEAGEVDCLPAEPIGHPSRQIDASTAEDSPADVRILQFAEHQVLGGVPVDEWVDVNIDSNSRQKLIALRVDGESMSPMIRCGDRVIVDLSAPPLPGKPCIAKLRDQIGVTCKIWRVERKRVHLIPANDLFPITRHEMDDILYVQRVVAIIKPVATN